MLIYVDIGEAQFRDAPLCQESTPSVVIGERTFFIVLSSIDLYREFDARSIKIQDIIPYPILPREIRLALLQVQVPKDRFLMGGIALPTVPACVIQIVRVVSFHTYSIISNKSWGVKPIPPKSPKTPIPAYGGNQAPFYRLIHQAKGCQEIRVSRNAVHAFVHNQTAMLHTSRPFSPRSLCPLGKGVKQTCAHRDAIYCFATQMSVGHERRETISSVASRHLPLKVKGVCGCLPRKRSKMPLRDAICPLAAKCHFVT